MRLQGKIAFIVAGDIGKAADDYRVIEQGVQRMGQPSPLSW